MSYPVENQATMTGYRRTGDNDALEMDSPGDHYTQSRTLSANRGPNGMEICFLSKIPAEKWAKKVFWWRGSRRKKKRLFFLWFLSFPSRGLSARRKGRHYWRRGIRLCWRWEEMDNCRCRRSLSRPIIGRLHRIGEKNSCCRFPHQCFRLIDWLPVFL